jgi:hypothetical protein
VQQAEESWQEKIKKQLYSWRRSRILVKRLLQARKPLGFPYTVLTSLVMNEKKKI